MFLTFEPSGATALKTSMILYEGYYYMDLERYIQVLEQPAAIQTSYNSVASELQLYSYFYCDMDFSPILYTLS